MLLQLHALQSFGNFLIRNVELNEVLIHVKRNRVAVADSRERAARRAFRRDVQDDRSERAARQPGSSPKE